MDIYLSNLDFLDFYSLNRSTRWSFLAPLNLTYHSSTSILTGWPRTISICLSIASLDVFKSPPKALIERERNKWLRVNKTNEQTLSGTTPNRRAYDT